MAERKYTNESQQNMGKVVMYLAQDILVPKSQKELAEALNLSKSQAHGTIWNLIDLGWVEENAGAYRLSPRMTIISDRLRLAVADVIEKYIPNADCGVRNAE